MRKLSPASVRGADISIVAAAETCESHEKPPASVILLDRTISWTAIVFARV